MGTVVRNDVRDIVGKNVGIDVGNLLVLWLGLKLVMLLERMLG